MLTAMLAGIGSCTPPTAETKEVDECAAVRRQGPPSTRRENVVDRMHGVDVADPYRWLEEVDEPEVQAWMDAQDQYARADLSALPRRQQLAQQLRALIDVDSISVPVHRGSRLFFARRSAGHDHAVWYVREDDGRERVVLDPLQLDSHGRISVRAFVPSPDGRLVAYLRSFDGADAAELRIREVDTGRDRADRIAGARYAAAAWAADGRSFAYTGLPDDPSIPAPELPRHAEVRVHVLGTPVSQDEVIYGPLGDAATFVGVESLDEGRTWALHVQHGWSATDVYLREATTEAVPWRPLFVGHDALASVSSHEGRYFVLTDHDAPRFRVVEVDPDQPSPEHWRTVVAQQDGTLESAGVFGGRLLLRYLKKASSSLEIRELSGAAVHEVDFDGFTSISAISGRAESDVVYVHHGAMNRAPQVGSLSMDSGTLRTWEAIDVPVDEHLELHQVSVESRDGTPVSMFVLHRDDVVLDGNRPTILTGYGGFGVSLQPSFSATAAVWAGRGGVWAMPNLRGGGEYGEAWHDAGRRANKQNTFDDFIAAAEYLQAEGYTQASRLAIRGGSNGGLLVGAVSTQRPELFGAVVCAVPLLDMIRFHRFGSGPTWIGEYGSAEDPEQFGWLWGYSPLHKVRPQRHYPALLMLSADNDDRVDPMHARKYVAAMQHAGADALLRIERGAGHGGSPRVGDRIDAEVDTLAFVLDRLDAGPNAP